MNFKDLIKKAFGKEKDERIHAIVMLSIYAIFILIVIFIIRISNPDSLNNKQTSPKSTSDIQEEIKQDKDKKKSKSFDINYSYSYKIIFDGETETYLGKKLDNKEKFSYINGDITKDYAIYNDNYLILEEGTYHVTDKLDTYFKYCNMEKIVDVVDTEKSADENGYVYDVSNSKIASLFSEILTDYNKDKTNRIELIIENENLKIVKMDLSNYISNILKEDHTLNITMEFANVGTTEDFQIKMN